MLKNRRHDDPQSRKRMREQPLSRLFPNMITLAGLCCGMSAIRFAMVGRWEFAVGFVLAAALIDGMDGRVARMLGATSTFGAQLDSLADFLSFGIAPALVMYMWIMHDIKGIGWAVALFFTVCTALRLARFNTALFDDQSAAWKKQFFVGVPSPAGGMLSMLPLIISIQSEGEIIFPALAVCIYVLIIGATMASRIPTFSGKKIRIKHDTVPIFMLVAAAMIVTFIIEPWMFMIIMGALYFCSMALSGYRWNKLSKQTDSTPPGDLSF